MSDGLATDPPDDSAPDDQRAEIIGIRATSRGQSAFLLRSQANGRFFRAQEPDKIIYADEADPNMATGWVILFVDDPNGQPQVLVIEDADGISTTLNFLQRDPSTNRLHLVALDIVSGITDPNSYINISQ